MKKQIEQVAAFMKMAGQDVSKGLNNCSDEVKATALAKLRVKLQQEELDEMRATLREPMNLDMVQLADDIVDQLYILFGTINSYGLQDYITTCFEAVHKANMSKGHLTPNSANQTLMYWEKERGEKCVVSKIDELWVVHNESGKLMKNIHYKEADLKAILESNQFGFSQEEIKEAVENMPSSIVPFEWEPLSPNTFAKEIEGLGTLILHSPPKAESTPPVFIKGASIISDESGNKTLIKSNDGE